MRLKAALVLLCGLVLAGCSGPIFTRFLPVTYDPTPLAYWRYAGAGQTFLIEVRGEPPVAPAAIAAAFPPPPQVAPPRGYTVDPAEAAHPEYRFVLAFGVPDNYSGDAACAGREPTAKGDGMIGSFCYRSESLAQVHAAQAEEAFAAGPQSSAARNFLYRLASYLVPFPAEDGTGGCGPFGDC